VSDTVSVYAQTSESAKTVCEGANLLTGGEGCTKEGSGMPELFKKIIMLLSWIVGIVAVIMIIFGGFWIITANGDAQKVGKGRNTIIYAVIGLIVVLLAQIIVRFVINQFTQTPKT
jgi:cytochrome b561